MKRQAFWLAVSLVAHVFACASGVQDLETEQEETSDETGRDIANGADETEPGSRPRKDAGGASSKDASPGKAASPAKDASQGAPPSPPTSNVMRVFMTSTKYTGNLGGLSGADAKCAAAANAAQLGGTWIAWISDSFDDAMDRVYDVGPWYTVDGTTKMFDDLVNLTAASLSDQWQDEHGVAVPYSFAWTSTMSGYKTAPNCNEWTSASVDGKRTLLSLGVTTTHPCSYASSLLCVEQ